VRRLKKRGKRQIESVVSGVTKEYKSHKTNEQADEGARTYRDKNRNPRFRVERKEFSSIVLGARHRPINGF
jgi:hypothetical protein